MVMKNYPPQFKADAVALYQSRPEATIRSVAADLRINPETLRNWVRADGASRPRGRRTEAPAEPLRREAAVHHPGPRRFQLLLLAPHHRRPDRPAGGRRRSRRTDTGRAP
ncbi:hypothetical protein C0R05_06010 [Streptomyces albidoflavus]|nr:hypothetical protein C0R05_06010 [Streptomyces albidoflavus]